MNRDDTHIDWQSLGQQFRQQRETAAISVETAARQLCLAPSQVLALEEGLAANFPGTPARLWCARRYARLLGLDLEEIAPCAHLSASPTEAEINAPTLLDISLSNSESLARTPPSSMHKARWPRWFLLLLFPVLLAVLVIQTYHPVAPVPTQVRPVMIPKPPEPAPVSVTVTASLPAVTPVDEPKPEPERKLVEVQGIDARKPARSIYVMANEAAVLIKQRAGQEAETLNLEKGASQRIPLAADERLRVAEGKKIDLFFQGRKVSTSNIESGDWIRFVPLRGAAVP